MQRWHKKVQAYWWKVAASLSSLLSWRTNVSANYPQRTTVALWFRQSMVVPTVSLIPVPRGRASITISGLQGVDLPLGPVNITGDDANKFTDCPLSNCTGCLPCTSGRGMWNAISRKLYLNLFSEINAFQNVKLKFKFNNAIIGQDSPVLQIEIVQHPLPSRQSFRAALLQVAPPRSQCPSNRNLP